MPPKTDLLISLFPPTLHEAMTQARIIYKAHKAINQDVGFETARNSNNDYCLRVILI